jgi:hypothetical protein
MAKFVANDYKITINGSNFSSSLASVELNMESADVETTPFGTEWVSRTGGLKSAAVTLSWHQDFGAGAVDATLWPLLNTLATVVITPTSAAVSATNPSYTCTALVNNYIVSGASGELATFDVTWPVSGTVVRGTAA